MTMTRRVLFGLIALLLTGAAAHAETHDFYVFTYCPSTDPMCGFASNETYRAYIETAVQEMNVEWERIGMSFHPVVFDIEQNDYYGVTQGCDGDVSQTIKDRRVEWKANVAALFPDALSVMITPGGSWCCSHIPGTPYGHPENDAFPALFGLFCSTSWGAVELGGILAHEVGHSYCLVHTQTFRDPATDGPNPDQDNDDCCGIGDTNPDPARLEGYDPKGPWGDLDINGNPVNGHQWCTNQSLDGLTDDGSPHDTLCQPTCFLFQNNVQSVTSDQPPSDASMSYYMRSCIGPYVRNGQTSYAFGDDSVDQVRNVCIPQVPERANLPDVCAGHGGDPDFDGICNAFDNCPAAKNTPQADADGDGTGDVCDLCPGNPNATGDMDQDGVGDLCDPDKDGDTCDDDTIDEDPDNGRVRIGFQFQPGCGFGIEPVYASAEIDSDHDGIKGCQDVDDDNDGICDGAAAHGPGSPGAPAGCTAGPDPCTEAPDLSCYGISGSPVLCQPPWLVCLGGGCVEFFLKIVSVINPGDEVVLDGGMSILNRKIYTSPLAGATLSQTGKALAGDFASLGLAGGSPGAAAASDDADAVTGLLAPGRVRLEIWSHRSRARVAIVGEYDPSQVVLGDLARGTVLELEPTVDASGLPHLGVKTAYDRFDNDSPMDTDADRRPDSMDDCLAVPNFLQIDADGDGFGNACDADIDGDFLITSDDVAAVHACAGADLTYEGLIGEPESDEGAASPDAVLTGLKERCRAMDLDDNARVDAADENLARAMLGLPPGPSAKKPSTTGCTPANCDDGLACTFDYCDASGVCRHVPGACNDKNPCTTDSCNPLSGACTHTAVACNDGNPCTSDSCDPALGCRSVPVTDGLPCDDGSACTQGETCRTGVCGGGLPLGCDDHNPCTTDSCSPATAVCVHTPACDDGNPCTADSCGPTGSCTHQPVSNGTICNDGNACTVGDVCSSGVCSAPPKNCDDGSLCTVDLCESSGQCVHTPKDCDDGNACTTDSCLASTGQCVNLAVPFGLPTLSLAGPASLSWDGPPGTTWNTYRGTIPATLMGSRRQTYDHECLETLDFLEDGPRQSLDPGLPPPGAAFYYFVTERNSCGEGLPGFDSNGTPVPNASPCLTGP
jgi:hypothetical protein